MGPDSYSTVELMALYDQSATRGLQLKWAVDVQVVCLCFLAYSSYGNLAKDRSKSQVYKFCNYKRQIQIVIAEFIQISLKVKARLLEIGLSPMMPFPLGTLGACRVVTTTRLREPTVAFLSQTERGQPLKRKTHWRGIKPTILWGYMGIIRDKPYCIVEVEYNGLLTTELQQFEDVWCNMGQTWIPGNCMAMEVS